MAKSIRPHEDSAVVRFEKEYVRPKEGLTLIVGSRVYGDKEDRRLRYPKAMGVDMEDGPGVNYKVDMEDWGSVWECLEDDWAHIECMSVLEHSRRPWLIAQNLQSLMESGSTIFLTVPFIWRVHGYPSDYWRFTPDCIRILFPHIEWKQLMFAHTDLSDNVKTPALKQDGMPYYMRTEVVGFGVKV